MHARTRRFPWEGSRGANTQAQALGSAKPGASPIATVGLWGDEFRAFEGSVVDGYITGPNDGPGKGLGDGGERLHYWVFGGPWTYADEPRGEPTGEDAAWLAEVTSRVGAVVGGRSTYEAARHWGDKNPWGLPFFIVTHRPEEQPADGEFTFVSGVETAVERALESAGDKDVHVMGGAEIIRQALTVGIVDELAIIIAPVVLAVASDCSRDSHNRWTWSTSGCGSPRSRRSSTTEFGKNVAQIRGVTTRLTRSAFGAASSRSTLRPEPTVFAPSTCTW